ncbi:MAG: hypothetical protein E7261_07940 [Lachnospiraceae bacterium]|nr:hypothetical protein [Lachnospiraceae bacterium]
MQSQIGTRYLWLPVSIANYLTAVKRKKVAVVELSEKKALEEMVRYFKQDIRDGEYFDLFGVRYYPYYKEKLLPKLLKEKYNYIIFDGLKIFGNRRVDLSDYDKKLLVGSLKIWEAAEYKECIEQLLADGRREEYFLLAEYFERREGNYFKKEINNSFIQLPAGLNPFRIRRAEFYFFETFL